VRSVAKCRFFSFGWDEDEDEHEEEDEEEDEGKAAPEGARTPKPVGVSGILSHWRTSLAR
jgi:hypothetical protein